MKPKAGDIWKYSENEHVSHYLMLEFIRYTFPKDSLEKNEWWVALHMESGVTKDYYWFHSKRWTKVA